MSESSKDQQNLSTPFRLLLPRLFYEEMIEQAKQELPNECCGVLAGYADKNPSGMVMARVVRRYPLVNVAKNPEKEYLSEPKSMFTAWRDMRVADFDILAVYHSHPTSDSKPSRKDRQGSYSSDVVNFIVSLKDGNIDVGGWCLTQDDYWSASWSIDEQLAARVNVNTATIEELMTGLPGIGASLASRIVEYRSRGHFRSVDDLKKVAGISRKRLQQIRDFAATGHD